MAFAGSKMQRCHATTGSGIDTGTVIKQNPRTPDMILLDSTVQGHPTAMLDGVDVGTIADQDLQTVDTALLGGDVLSPESTALMQEIVSPADEYALGLHAGPDFGMGHGGAILGFNSMMQLDPTSGDLLIVVVNNDLRDPAAVSGRVWDAVGGS